jgi:cysteine sulfinate desulfinase/cysteine desulfurase-like protein
MMVNNEIGVRQPIKEIGIEIFWVFSIFYFDF